MLILFELAFYFIGFSFVIRILLFLPFIYLNIDFITSFHKIFLYVKHFALCFHKCSVNKYNVNWKKNN